ncbi:MAG: PaaI family thioesterase [Geminicoccaceae bacterium]
MDEQMGAFGRWLGMEIHRWEEGLAVLSLAIRPEMLNRSGILHGGVLTTLMDTAGGYAGTYCPVDGNIRKALTLSLTTQFTGQARSGVITATATHRGGGRKSFFADIAVTEAAGGEISFGSGTWRYRTGHDDPRGVPLASIEQL